METAGDIQAALRRFGYRRKAKVNPLDGIDDPRLAAFVNMDGAIGREEIAAIARECATAFHAEPAEAEQIGAYGRWLVQQSGNMDEAVRRLAKNLEGKLTVEEEGQLFGMIERVTSIDGGGLSDSQRYTLDQLAPQLS